MITTNVGAVEDWTIENRALETHAFHMHQIHFKLLEVDGKPVPNTDLRDTIEIPFWSGKGPYHSVKVRMDFRDPTIAGTFLFHCHILLHEDLGHDAQDRGRPVTLTARQTRKISVQVTLVTIHVTRKSLLVVSGAILFLAGCFSGSRLQSPGVVHAATSETDGVVPKSYGRLVAAIADRIGTGLVFEDKDGVIRFVSITGMKEGQLNRYDKSSNARVAFLKSYGHLVAAVVNGKGTGLVFEDADGVIRFVTITGEMEGELKRE